MKRGHVTGTKRERNGQGWWYRTPEAEELIAQLEKEAAEGGTSHAHAIQDAWTPAQRRYYAAYGQWPPMRLHAG